MKKLLAAAILAASGALLFALIPPAAQTRFRNPGPGDPVPIPKSVQRKGDTARGREYLVTGDYLKSGLPLAMFRLAMAKGGDNVLGRTGMNREIPYEYTAVKASNGEIVVAPNCLQCHASVFEGKFVLGLGNTTIDFSNAERLNPRTAAQAAAFLRRADPAKYAAAAPFFDVVQTIGDKLTTRVRGVNAADRLAALLVAHRDPQTLRWSDSARMEVPDAVIPSDVPAWWLLKKKNGMFYNGFGRGDFGRFLMASNLLTVSDSSESAEVDAHFGDVLAYLCSLEAPKYPNPVDRKLAQEGGILYVQQCAKCHGNGNQYPNLLIPESVIGTDSALFASNYQSPQFVDWFNRSWFASGDHPARLEPFDGYIAPPLDGIWCTAPYFHNGSVPTLEGVLDSRARPRYWSRNFDSLRYDDQAPGWVYTRRDRPAGKDVYNTDLPGYGNYGHRFGDKLSARERKAVIEYLKTL